MSVCFDALIIKTDSSNYVIITIQYIKIGAKKYEINNDS